MLWHTVQQEDEPALFYRGHLNLRGMPEGKPVRLGGAGTEWVWQVRGNGYMAGWPLPSKHGIAARRLNTDISEEPLGGSLAWTGDSWLVAWASGIPPYDQSSIFLRRFAKR